MRSLIKRRFRQGMTLVLTPVYPFIGERGRRWATRVVNPRGKLYIPPRLGVTGFFRAMQQAQARHVVLRWFEELPHVERGHDLDVLVADDAVDTVAGLLSTWPRGQKIDIYSVSGARGTGYQPEVLNDVPAFPREVAEALLDSATEQKGGWSVPAPREHFLGLAFHAVYLKGFASGLAPDEASPPRKKGSRDYAAVLTALGNAAGIRVDPPVTMAGLDRVLGSVGWRPDDGHLAALAPANPAIGEVI